jgi:hypothetical protein
MATWVVSFRGLFLRLDSQIYVLTKRMLAILPRTNMVLRVTSCQGLQLRLNIQIVAKWRIVWTVKSMLAALSTLLPLALLWRTTRVCRYPCWTIWRIKRTPAALLTLLPPSILWRTMIVRWYLWQNFTNVERTLAACQSPSIYVVPTQIPPARLLCWCLPIQEIVIFLSIHFCWRKSRRKHQLKCWRTSLRQTFLTMIVLRWHQGFQNGSKTNPSIDTNYWRSVIAFEHIPVYNHDKSSTPCCDFLMVCEHPVINTYISSMEPREPLMLPDMCNMQHPKRKRRAPDWAELPRQSECKIETT